MRSLLIFSFMFSFAAWAQNRYELKGFYTSPGKLRPTSYSLNWVEEAQTVRGMYKDHSMKESIKVDGLIDKNVRIFRLPLSPNVVLMTSLPKGENQKMIPVSITFLDENLAPGSSSVIEASFAMNSASKRQAQEATTCRDGFGNLKDMCGTYRGLVVEEQDSGNKCALTATSNLPELQLKDSGEIDVNVPSLNTLSAPSHHVGRIPFNSDKASVDVLGRVCRTLNGTKFAGDDCKRLNVTGEFSRGLDNNPHFFGTYVIVDEKTNERCQYRLSVDRTKSQTTSL
jgi:hypothetical protein